MDGPSTAGGGGALFQARSQKGAQLGRAAVDLLNEPGDGEVLRGVARAATTRGCVAAFKRLDSESFRLSVK